MVINNKYQSTWQDVKSDTHTHTPEKTNPWACLRGICQISSAEMGRATLTGGSTVLGTGIPEHTQRGKQSDCQLASSLCFLTTDTMWPLPHIPATVTWTVASSPAAMASRPCLYPQTVSQKSPSFPQSFLSAILSQGVKMWPCRYFLHTEPMWSLACIHGHALASVLTQRGPYSGLMTGLRTGSRLK